MEEMKNAVEAVETEVENSACAVKEWLNNTLYEANRLLQEHKKVILTIVAAAAGVAALVTAICVLVKKK